MEGNHQRERAPETKLLKRAKRRVNGTSGVRSLSAINAQLLQENAELSCERDLLRLIINSLPDLIYVKDADSRFLTGNSACARALGASSANEIIGKTDFDFFPGKSAERYLRDEQALMRSGQTLNTVESFSENGAAELRWMQTTKVARRDRNGNVIGLIGIGRDITELKQAKEATSDELQKRTAQLSQERVLLRTLIDNLPDCIYAKDPEGRKTLANPADLKNLRCKTEAEAIGKSDFDFFPREIAEKFWADDQKVIRGQPVINREEHFPDEQGRPLWLLTSKLPLRDTDGKIKGLIGIGRNITRQKQMQTELAYEQQLFRTLLEHSPARIYFKDLQSRFVRFSNAKSEGTLEIMRKAWRKDHPKDPPDTWPSHLANVQSFSKWLVGKTDLDTYPEAIALSAHQDEQKIMRTGRPIINQLQRGQLADGQVLWWLVTKMPWRDLDGKIIGIFGASQDVTPLKEAEESLDRERMLLRTLIDNLPDSIYAKDKSGHYILNNPAHMRHLGAKSLEEMKGKSDFDYFPKEQARQFFEDEQRIIETGVPVINQEQYESGPDAVSRRWMIISKVLWRDHQGQVLGTMGITRDIHEIKAAQEAVKANEAKLRKFAAQLERSNRELEDFAYVASHDLQEPLRKIVVFGERLQEKAADRLEGETLDYLQRMRKAASRMQSLINDLLAFSRVTTRAQPFTLVDLAQTAREVIEDLEARIEMTQGRVEQGALPAIEAEPLQMRQLLQNLIGNALKFRRPEVPPVVKIEAKIFSGVMPQAPPDTANQDWCELTVSDNGIGFDEKYLDRVFNVFQRLHTRNEYEGTGMGLAIARKIVMHHGGFITARSSPGQGAAFIATLPICHSKPNTMDP
jgi:PAS domain S-box-containing protein